MSHSSKIQPYEEIESFYEKPDPWGYKTRPDDIVRRDIMLELIPKEINYVTTLDIGCGEGFITEELPGSFVTGVDISKNAIARAKGNERVSYQVKNINDWDIEERKYDLVTCSGVLYPHYITDATLQKIIKATNKILISCHAREVGKVEIPLEPIDQKTFTYDGMVEDIFVYDLRRT